jgi:beta-lactam-binding protein with PASTA domain
MSLKQFLFSRLFLRHLILAILLLSILIFITLKGLNTYTHHGEAYPVPDFSGLTVEQAEKTARHNNLKTELIDSVHIDDALPGVIVEQVPEAGLKVKRNRVVFLTKNSMQPEMITVPKLTDISFRQALVLIENCGLQVGTIFYHPSEFNDLVLNVQKDSTDIRQGQQLAKGSRIDLIIGRNQGNISAPLPNLIGLTINEALMSLTGAMLNPGVIIYDNSFVTKTDSLNAMVWKQQPTPKITPEVNLGTSVDLWVTIDALKIATETIISEEQQ